MHCLSFVPIIVGECPKIFIIPQFLQVKSLVLVAVSLKLSKASLLSLRCQTCVMLLCDTTIGKPLELKKYLIFRAHRQLHRF